MKLFLSLKAAGIVLLLGGLPAELLAAHDPFDKLELRATLTGNFTTTRSIDFSPDGKLLAVGSNDGTIKLWDTVNAKCLRILKGHGIDSPKARSYHVHVLAVAFSPDGKTLATSGDDWTIRLWDVATGESKSVLNKHVHANSLSFSPDGNRLAVAHSYVIDLKEEKQQPILTDSNTYHRKHNPVFSYYAKGQLLVASAVALDEKKDIWNTVMVWGEADGKTPLILNGHTRHVIQLALSHDGRLLASADLDKVVSIWNLESGKAIATIADVPDLSDALAFSPDGKVLACGGRPSAGGINRDPGKVRLLRVSDGKLLATLDGYTSAIGSIVFSPQGRLLATGDVEGIKLWNLPAQLPGFKDK